MEGSSRSLRDLVRILEPIQDFQLTGMPTGGSHKQASTFDINVGRFDLGQKDGQKAILVIRIGFVHIHAQRQFDRRAEFAKSDFHLPVGTPFRRSRRGRR